MEFTD